MSLGLQEELNEYYRLLAVLEQEARRTEATLQADSARRPAQTAEVDLAGGSSGLTLLRMKAWMQEPLER